MNQHIFSAFGQTYVRYVFNVNEGLSMHMHDVDHLTIVASGRIIATTDSRSVEKSPNDTPILFKAHRRHEIKALEKNTVIINVFKGEVR
jgi:hypothetical protein